MAASRVDAVMAAIEVATRGPGMPFDRWPGVWRVINTQTPILAIQERCRLSGTRPPWPVGAVNAEMDLIRRGEPWCRYDMRDAVEALLALEVGVT